MTGPLPDTAAAIVQQLLVNLGVCSLPGTSGDPPVFCNSMPDSPDAAVAVYDTEGRIHGRAQVTGEIQEHLGIQIKVRASKHQDGVTHCEQIKEALDLTVYRTSVTMPTTAHTYLVQAITRTSGILVLGKEIPGSKRSLFTINALVSVTKTI